MRITPLADADLPAVLEVYRQCEDFLALGPQPRASAAMVAADLAHSRAAGGEFCGLWDESGRLVGVLDLLRTGFAGDPQCGFIELLMVAAPWRSAGLGAAATAWALAQMRAGGAARAATAVQVNNPAALRFWLRQGFTLAGPPQPQPDGTVTCLLEQALA